MSHPVTLDITRHTFHIDTPDRRATAWLAVRRLVLTAGLGVGVHKATWNEESEHLELEDRERWINLADDLGKTNADRSYVEAYLYSEGVRCRPPRTVTGVAVGASGSSGG